MDKEAVVPGVPPTCVQVRKTSFSLFLLCLLVPFAWPGASRPHRAGIQAPGTGPLSAGGGQLRQ